MSEMNGDDDSRNYCEEARNILAGTSALLPEKRHLEALAEAHEAEIARIVGALHSITMKILTADRPRV